mmetsp:Transcript_7464/g.27969  ORF Transcript_7464/g.27969 Transcript_7464/m.27969 type:complete len:2086 (-) Transcript_7464:47-6304(-)
MGMIDEDRHGRDDVETASDNVFSRDPHAHKDKIPVGDSHVSVQEQTHIEESSEKQQQEQQDTPQATSNSSQQKASHEESDVEDMPSSSQLLNNDAAQEAVPHGDTSKPVCNEPIVDTPPPETDIELPAVEREVHKDAPTSESSIVQETLLNHIITESHHVSEESSTTNEQVAPESSSDSIIPEAPPLPPFLLNLAPNATTFSDEQEDNTYEDSVTFADMDEEDELEVVLSLQSDLKSVIEDEKSFEEQLPQHQQCVDAYTVVNVERKKQESKHHQVKNNFLKADQVDPTVREAYRTCVSSWKVVVPKRSKYTQIVAPLDYLFSLNLHEIAPADADAVQKELHLITTSNRSNLKYLDAEVGDDSVVMDNLTLTRLNPDFFYSPAEVELCGKVLSDIPYRISDPEKFLFTARHLSLKLGRVEPLFCRVALFDVKNEVKISEDFCFHLNPLNLTQWMDKNLAPELMKYVFKNPRSLMTVNDVHEEVYLVLFVEKILQDSLENVTKPYLLPERVQDRSELKRTTKEYVGDLSYFRQVMAWGYCNLFQAAPYQKPGSLFKGRASISQTSTPVSPNSSVSCATMGSPMGARKLSFSSVGTQNDTEPSTPVAVPNGSGTPTSPRGRHGTVRVTQQSKGANKSQSLSLRHGTFQISLFKIFENCQTNDIIQLLHNPDTIKKRCKQIPGNFIFEIHDADADFLLDDEDTNPLLNQTMENMPLLDAHIQSLKCERLLDESFHVTRELPLGGVPQSPYVDFVHMLYVYPLSLNLIGVSLPDVKHPRNLCIKVMLRRNDSLPKTIEGTPKPIMGEDVILPKYWDVGERSNDRFYLSCVTYHRRQPNFLSEEVKIVLPPILSPTHHLLFAVYHVSTEKKNLNSAHDEYTGNARKKLLGYSFVKLLDDRLNPRLNETCELPLYHKLDDHYLIDIPSQYLLDKRSNRKQLRINLRSVSSIVPGTPAIFEFFKLTSNLISTIDSNQKNKRILAASVSSMLQALTNLARIKFELVLPYFSSVMDALFRLLSRVDVFINSRGIDTTRINSPAFSQAEVSKTNHSLDDIVLKLWNETFACILSTVQKAGVHLNDFSRSNQILGSYVDYVFCEVARGDESWTYLVLTRHWLQLMTTDEAALVSNYSLFTKTKLLKILHTAVDYSLELSWFFFDIIAKSLTLLNEKRKKLPTEAERQQHAAKNSSALVEFSSYLHSLVQHISQSIFRFSTSAIFSLAYQKQAEKINHQLALFLSHMMNLIPLSAVIPCVHSYIDICEKYEEKVKVKSKCDFLRLDFLRLLMDNGYFVEANRVVPHDTRSHYIVNVICILVLKSVCIKSKSGESTPNYLDLLLDHLTKLDNDASMTSADKNRAAVLYFPFIQRLTQVTYLMHRDEEPDMTDSEHVHPFDVQLLPHLDRTEREKLSSVVLFLFRNVTDKVLQDWLVAIPAGQLSYLLRLLTFVLENFKEFEVHEQIKSMPMDKSLEHLECQKRNGYACFMLFPVFNRITSICMPAFLGRPHDFIRSVESCVQFISTYLEQNSFNLTVLRTFLKHTFIPFAQNISPLLSSSIDKNDCRWQQLLGAALRLLSFSSDAQPPKVFLQILDILCGMYPDESNWNSGQALEFEPDTYYNIVFDANHMVKAATLSKLIEQLISPSQNLLSDDEMELKSVFFLTFRSFTTPNELLNTLLSVCRFLSSAEQQNDILHMNVITLLTFWLNHHFYDFSNTFIVRLIHFLRSDQFSKMERLMHHKLHIHLVKNLMRMSQMSDEETVMQEPKKVSELPRKHRPIILPKHRVSEEKRMEMLLRMQEYTSYKNFDILEWSSLEIARQLTLIDYETYSMIQPKECFKNAWSKQDGSAPNIVKLTYRFNKISLWVATLIIRAADDKERKDIIAKFVEIARHALRGLRNFNVANSILGGLRDVGVFRLRSAWDLLSFKEDEAFESLCKALSHDDRYRNMRNVLDKSDEPAIPFLGVYLTDLTFIEDGNPDTIKIALKEEDTKVDTTHVKLINMSKRRLQSKIIREMLTHQTKPYVNIRKVEYLYESLLRVTEMPDIMEKEAIYMMSLEILPRGGKKSATVKQENTRKDSVLSSESTSPKGDSPLAS